MDYDEKNRVKMSGYLEKKGKLRMVSSWKKYWFVLEGRLLLYYRSKDEYEAISPCKGSINLGPPCTVKSYPSIACAFQIETRATIFTLRADNTVDQKKWMQAIMSALNQNQNFPTETATRLSHFRYSLDDLVPKVEPGDNQPSNKRFLERQNTMPERLTLAQRTSNDMIQRLQKMGAQSYGGSLGVISKIASKKHSLNKTDNEIVYHGSNSSVNYRNRGENVYERVSDPKTANFMVDNDNYSVPMRKTNSLYEQKNSIGVSRDTKSLLIENEQYYASVQKIRDDSNKSDEAIYAEPKVMDYNKNSVIIANSFYDVTRNSENEYEDLDKYHDHYSQPVFAAEAGSVDGGNKMKKTRNCLKKILSGKSEKRPVKKSHSLIRRVWKRKTKTPVKPAEEDDDEIYEEVDKVAMDKVEPSNDKAIEMLVELQSILEHKKVQLKKSISHDSSISQDTSSAGERKMSASSADDVVPALPIKMHKWFVPYNDDKSNQSSMDNQEPVRSLDEILQDLDRDRIESRTNVKMLIEKFNDVDDVTLRKHDVVDFKYDMRHSDELGRLLEELAKVTSAPIMTPGVTSSLLNPNLSDEEWLKLLPIRQRRLSEPDYDVPRPHKSLQLPIKHENSDAIPATRFFGPVLPPTPHHRNEESLCVSMTPDSLEMDHGKSPAQFSYTSHDYHQCKNGMDLDSYDLKCLSHNYHRSDQVIYALPKPYISVATHIVNTCQNVCGRQLGEEHTIVYKNVKNIDDEVYSDSLEICKESLTEL